MKSAIVRHILVKDKDLCEQLKKKIKAGADFAKNRQTAFDLPIIRQKKAVNSATLKKWPARLIKRFTCRNVNCMAQSKASLAWHLWKLSSGWINSTVQTEYF